MQLETITPAYLELNRELHARGHYGAGSFRWAELVSNLRDETESETVLDYGCGQGTLRLALGNPSWLREYDPAVPGRDSEPGRADLVVCTDVLEHIEPELIDNVLAHLADLALRAVFLNIALKPAIKVLADGRNAHILLRPVEWWREKLEKFFLISSWSIGKDELRMTGGTVRQLVNVITQSAVSDTIRYEQATVNCPLVADRVRGRDRHDGRVALVCYGPSLKHTWQTLRAERRLFGATIVSVSGAHDFLIERGIVPDIHIECDPREHKAFFTKNPHPDVKYWIASCCHPSLVSNLLAKKCQVALWHVYNSEHDRKIIAPDGLDPGNVLMAGAGSVGCRAFNVMFWNGYRTLSVYGMDCSFESTGEQHAGAHSGKRQFNWPVKVGNRWFQTSGALVATARGFIDNTLTLSMVTKRNDEPLIEGTNQRFEIFLHGDGLLAEMYSRNEVPVKETA